MPLCLGLYSKSDPECDGDSRATDKVARLKCAWSPYCSAFSTYCEESGEKREEHIETIDNGDGAYSRSIHVDHRTFLLFLKDLRATIQKAQGDAQEASGQATQAEGQAEGSEQQEGTRSKRRKRKARRWRRKSQAVAARKQEALALMVHFLQQLGRVFPGRLPAVGYAPRPGQFFWVDRRKSSGYVAVYCAPRGGRRIPVASMRPELLSRTLMVDLPWLQDEFIEYMSKHDRSRYTPSNLTYPTSFKSRLTSMELGGLTWLAEQLKRMCEKGAFQMPEVKL